MCTLTYLPIKNGFILTSSRDEKSFRQTLKPQSYIHPKETLVYPKDVVSGGTWIAASNRKRLACLLNGGFIKHERKETYSRSRGNVLLECFTYSSFHIAVKEINLEDVEPFTLLLIDFEKDIDIIELVWDGNKKHLKQIENDKATIWSSRSLYSQQDHELRKTWFENWINSNKDKENYHILDFHTTKHGNIDAKDILMKRENELQTVSISQIVMKEETYTFFYKDLKDMSTTKINLSETKCIQE